MKKMKKTNLLLILLLCLTTFLGAQEVKNYNIREEGKGGYYYGTSLSFGFTTGDELPFWMQANQYGLIPEQNYGLWGWGLKKEFMSSRKIDWALGIDGVASVSQSDETAVRLKDYYLGARYGKIRLYVGAKSDPIIYDGLSSTNGNFIWSSNARPYPKISLEIPYTNVPFTKSILQFKGAVSEGIMYDDRYVRRPHVHHKNLYLKAEKGRFAVEFGLNHYAQWGGKSPKYGKLPDGLGAYKDMFFASEHSKYDQLGSAIDQNRVGNHLGMLDGRFHYKANTFSLDFYRQVIFEDSSGQNFFNRDALHGVYVRRTKEKAWLQSFLLEYYYTKKQSGDKIGAKPDGSGVWTGRDNYFNQSVYRSGWTSYGHTIGVPFFTAIQGGEYALGVSNNRIEALHGGVSGFIAHRFPYKAKVSYTDNIGTYSKPIDKQQISAYFEVTFPMEIRNYPVNLTFGTAVDKGEYLEDNWGAFVKISTNGWWNNK